MKISKKAKGLVDYSDIYNPEIPFDEYPEPDYSDEALLAQEEMYAAQQREREENARAMAEWEAQGKRNLEIIRDVTGEIGKRLTHLFEQKHIEKIHFARQIGVSRSTLHRYCTGESVPGKKKLIAIIDALEMDVADFCYEPRNTEAWKRELEDKASRRNDIFELRDDLLKEISRNTFTYQYRGETIRLPHRYYAILKTMLEGSFRVLDLIAHDTKEWEPRKKKDAPADGSVTDEESEDK